MNLRISRLRKALADQKPKVCSERCNIFTESIKRNHAKPIAIRRAEAYYDVLTNMSIWVNDDELIVGNQAKWPKAAPIYPEYSTQWLVDEINGKPYYWDQRPGDRFYADEDVKQDILRCVSYWQDKTLIDYLRASLDDEILKAWDSGIIDETWVVGAGLGNEIPDYRMVVQKGLKDVIARAKAAREALDLKEPGNVKKAFFLDGVIRGNEAVCAFAKRIADECAAQAATCKSDWRKAELETLSEICTRVPYEPARTFHEAVQSIYFILLAVHLESNGHAISLGRFDQYVYPYYQADIEAGRMTPEGALEIIESFFIKCNELNKLRSWGDSEFFLGYQMFINMAICGQDKFGNDMTNDISYMCIDACAELKLVTPSLSIKCFEKTDKELMMKALEAAIMHQGGMPAFYNDVAFMETLRGMGIAEDDLCEWSPDGCIEASIPGKWDFAAKGAWLNVEKVLDITLHNGVDVKTGHLFRPTSKPIETCTSTEEILQEFTDMLAFFMDMQVVTEHANDYVHCIYDINPFRSSLIEDCIGRGLDLVEGGSVYSADGGPTAGSISAGDALAAIEYAVFDKKLVTLPALMHALDTNFEDEATFPTGSQLRAMLLNKAPKFGNDDDAADRWILAIEEFIGSRYHTKYHSSKYGKGPVPCCFSYSQSPVSGNIAFGRCIGATPDGRKDGMPVNNGVSPANGSERSGATAACNSVAKLPTKWIQKGAIFNMRLSKNAIATREKRERIVSMVQALFTQKAEQIQFNVVDTKVLQDAMAHPDNYQDLMVRVSGYSALFTSLAPACQQDVIDRHELDI